MPAEVEPGAAGAEAAEGEGIVYGDDSDTNHPAVPGSVPGTHPQE